MLKMFPFIREKYWFFRDYSFLLSEAKYKAKYARGLKITTTKQMLQRLPIALAKVKQVIHLKTYKMKSDKWYVSRKRNYKKSV